jgi:propionate CoA-transferase
VDLEKDVLAHMGFEPIIRGEPKLMDVRIFATGPMGLKDDLLTVPLEARFAYDAGRNTFFLNMEDMSLVSEDEAEAIGTEVGQRLAAIGKKSIWSSTMTTSTWPHPDRRLHLRGPRAGRALLRQRDQVHDQAPSCGSSSPSNCPTGDWPRTSMKAVKKP